MCRDCRNELHGGREPEDRPVDDDDVMDFLNERPGESANAPPGGAIKHFYTKVVGVTHENRDGRRRQDIIPCCHEGEQLEMVHEPDNPHDKNAIKVCRLNGDQLGYIRRELAEDIIKRLRNGYSFSVLLKNITVGDECLGANLLILQLEPGATVDDAIRYVHNTNASHSWGDDYDEYWELNIDA